MLWYGRSDGTDRHQLTFAPMQAGVPHLSPDGTQIAFDGRYPGAGSQIYIISVDGGDWEPITSGSADSEAPTWSPAGDALAYGGNFAEAAYGRGSLHIVNLRSRETTEVPDSKGFFSARWSPDGRYLVALIPQSSRVMLYDLNRRLWQKLTEAAPEVGYPEWSADGKCVYFNTPKGTNAPEKRVCLADRKVETIADMARGTNLALNFGTWTGVAPDGSIYALRDISSEEIYALDMKFP
jgi:Tol biopolymer transport system component